jgi:hypothetical protein
MSIIGYGYGSEWHMLRYLGYHRKALNTAVEELTCGAFVEWLDLPFNSQKKFLDDEWKGLDFLPDNIPAKDEWKNFWPQTGNVQNWDALGTLQKGSEKEFLLVEAKAHLGEIRSQCGAKEIGGKPLIVKALDEAKREFGVSRDKDWLQPYYQYCNRLAALHFLIKHGIGARLIFIYFLGDNRRNATCPKKEEEWNVELEKMYAHIGPLKNSALTNRIHHLFLSVRVDEYEIVDRSCKLTPCSHFMND